MLSRTPFTLAAQQSISCLKLSEWRALIIALALAITIASLMSVLGERIERTLVRQGAALLGADLVLSNSRPLGDDAIKLATELGLRSSRVIQLGTMAMRAEPASSAKDNADNDSNNNGFLLVSVRSLSTPYPRGEIELSTPSPHALPEIGNVWAEPSLLERLNLQLGDSIQLGKQQFTISNLIQSAPDRGRGFISFNPQLVINRAQLDSTGLLGPGARVQYRQLFAGDAKDIGQLETALNKQLKTGERLTSLTSLENQQTGALNKASAYLRLGALFALLIAAMTILLSLRRFTQSQHKRAALLKTLGLSDAQLLQLYLSQLGLAWLFCSAAGIGLAIGLETISLNLLHSLLPQPVPTAGLVSYLSGPAIGFTILFCLGLPALFKLQNSNPIQLLQGEGSSLSWGNKLPYLIALLLLLIGTSIYLNNLWLTLSLTFFILIVGSLLGWLGAAASYWLAKKGAPYYRLGPLLLSRITQQQRWYRIQVPVICLLFSLLSINLVALNDMLSRWQAQLPADTPNHFLINIQDWEKAPVEELLKSEQINTKLWPIYRGRLKGINDQPLNLSLTEEQQKHSSLNRELNLTWATQIPEHNKLTQGQWQEEQGVSLEQSIATALDIKMGDKLTFNIGGIDVSAQVSSFRSLRWDSFQPNFYYIFSPGILQQLPASYITSFHLNDNSASLSQKLIQQFPTLTLIDVRQILNQLQQLLERLSLLSSLLMLLTTSAGVVLLYVTLTQELEQRRYENALLQTLGASAAQCKQLDKIEMGLIGAISGFMAVIISELSLWPIHQQLLKLDPVLHPILWVGLPLISSGLFILVSWVSHRQQSLAESYRTLIARS